jgi:hypothetical protein
MKANKKINAIYSAIKKAPKAERLALLRAGMALVSRANQTKKK